MMHMAVTYFFFVRMRQFLLTLDLIDIYAWFIKIYGETRLPVTHWVKLSLNFELLVPK